MRNFFDSLKNSTEIIALILSLAVILKMLYEFTSKEAINWQTDLKDFAISLIGAIVFFALLELIALLLKTIRGK
ncbi:hypothetical protein [Lentilactobacillus senioris]|uniref:hypothetical protein n=1 Tax=Lentilactobacillus senioris TaxID=931534 RepID=UPI003D2E2744